MKLKKIIENLHEVRKIEGKTSLEIEGLACNSKAVKKNYLFIAIKGSRYNGADFIDEAIDRGARAIILEHNSYNIFPFRRGPTYIYVSDVRCALSETARIFYGNPSSRMHLIGVTGTNGKTTVTYLLESLFKTRLKKVGLIGTINYRFGNRLIPAVNTTPGILDLCSLLSSMYKQGLKNCILEVSSHSLEQGRVDILDFDMAVFTNLTSEHLDYHKSLENYFSSKLKLFAKIKKGGFAIINRDDPFSERIIEKVNLEEKASIITYGVEHEADVFAENVEISLEGLRFRLCAAVETNPRQACR